MVRHGTLWWLNEYCISFQRRLGGCHCCCGRTLGKRQFTQLCYGNDQPSHITTFVCQGFHTLRYLNSPISPQQVALYPLCSALPLEWEGPGGVRVQSVLPQGKSAVGYTNCNYLTAKTHIHETSSHWSQKSNRLNYNQSSKEILPFPWQCKLHTQGSWQNQRLFRLSRSNGKNSFLFPKIRKCGQATIRMRRVEGGRDLWLKAEKIALGSHLGGNVAILLPWRGWRISERSTLLPFSEGAAPSPSNSSP